jgi:hypothetical protein
VAGTLVPGDQVRVGAERPDPDDRVVRRRVHVHRRGQVHADTEGGQVPAQGLVHGCGQAHVVHRAERRVARVAAAGQVGDPGDIAAFLVDGQHRLAARSAQLGGERGQLLRSRDVRAEDGDAGQPLFQRGQHPPGRPLAAKRRDQHRVGQPGQGRVGRQPGAHPFTAPATRPAVIRRWTRRKNTTTGMVYRVDAGRRPEGGCRSSQFHCWISLPGFDLRLLRAATSCL